MKANYEKRILNTGEIIEMSGFWEESRYEIQNPPRMLSDKEVKSIIKLMKKNNIKRLDIIV